MKNRKNYVMTKSNLTLTQSGLLAVLLQRQHYKIIQLARRRAHGARCELPFGVASLGGGAHSRHEPSSTIPRSPLWEPVRATLEPFTKANCHVSQIHTYTELRQKIHDDLRIQHPEWVERNGESPCVMLRGAPQELLETFTRTGSSESIAAVHRVLEQESN